jgi:acyl-CoA thioester hydrolase
MDRARDEPDGDPRALRRADFPVLRAVPTRWSDEDRYGHLNNAVHYLLFDTAVNGWLIEASGTDIRRLPAIGVVAETGCRYLAELHFPEAVQAGIRLVRLGRTSVVYQLALFTARAASPAAVGRFVHVYVDAASREPAPVPPEIRAALDLLTERDELNQRDEPNDRTQLDERDQLTEGERG